MEGKKMQQNKTIVESVRRKFLIEVKENPSLYHEKDVERIQSNDWSVERFVRVNKSEDEALKSLIKAMQWRKSFGVNEFSEASFPKEFYQIGKFHIHGKDKEGRLILWSSLKNHHKVSEFKTLEKQFFVFMVEKIDNQSNGNQWLLVGDPDGMGVFNIDPEFYLFTVNVLEDYYPSGVKYLIGIDYPVILNEVVKLLIASMKPELKNTVKLIDRSKSTDFIEADVIPVHLGGSFEGKLSHVPSNVKTMEELNFDANQVKKFYSTYKSFYQEFVGA